VPLNEFSLIERYFGDTGSSPYPAVLSQGDDAAVIEVPPGMQAVMSMDTLICDVHFPTQTSAGDIASKALAVNLSDLAAMAATPAWFMLSLSLPGYDESWLQSFSNSLKRSADRYQLELIGGDTCRGPLSVTIQITGLVESGRQITRQGARPGDKILVSGTLGCASLGLEQLQQKIQLPEATRELCLSALNQPIPRLELVDFLSRYASAAIDLSDGLVGDLGHILKRSGVGAQIRQADLPVNEWLKKNNAYRHALYGGDDYEICFALPAEHYSAMLQWNLHHPDCLLTEIGEITKSGYTLIVDNRAIDLNDQQGYQHFG
jgi:thiamine-monophosphate kinase